MTTIKIGYFADGVWGHNAFKKIMSDTSLKIVFVTVRFDRQDPILVRDAEENHIPLLLSNNINSKDFLETVVKYQADILVSMSFDQIFKAEILGIPGLGIINCHAGKLPFYRGRNILNWVLINDEKEFGITVHYVDEGIDTGDIILQRCFPITDDDSYETLLRIAHLECANVLYDAIKQIQNGSVTRKQQSDIHPVGMYCGKRQEGDERLDWNQTSREIFNFVRAICSPGPGARTRINRTKRECRIEKVIFVKDAPVYKGTPGQIIGKNGRNLIVKTQDSYVEVVDYYCDEAIKIGDRLL